MQNRFCNKKNILFLFFSKKMCYFAALFFTCKDMPTIKQLSVFLERGAGSLRNVVETLADAEINITKMTIDGSSDHNVIRMLVSAPEECYRLLKSCGYNICITTTTNISDETEDLSQTNILSAKMINGQLHLSGLTPGRAWSVYNMYGEVVYQNVAQKIHEIITLNRKDVYLVQSDNRTVRVSY